VDRAGFCCEHCHRLSHGQVIYDFFRCVSLADKKQTNQRFKFSFKKHIHKIKCLTNKQPKYSADTKRRRVATGDSLRRRGKISITTSSSHGAKLQYRRMSSDRKPFISRSPLQQPNHIIARTALIPTVLIKTKVIIKCNV